jgi:hypothetical protein
VQTAVLGLMHPYHTRLGNPCTECIACHRGTAQRSWYLIAQSQQPGPNTCSGLHSSHRQRLLFGDFTRHNRACRGADVAVPLLGACCMCGQHSCSHVASGDVLPGCEWHQTEPAMLRIREGSTWMEPS